MDEQIEGLVRIEVFQEDKAPGKAAQQDPAAQKWATLMTTRYDELSKADPIFGELRNIMDMCVAAAVIRSNDLQQQADLELPYLSGQTKSLTSVTWATPRHVSTETSFIKSSRGLVITASGGVDIDYLAPTENPEINAGIKKIWDKAEASASSGSWWN